jgi:hypothetical protein
LPAGSTAETVVVVAAKSVPHNKTDHVPPTRLRAHVMARFILNTPSLNE